jgi:hypothetical protein
MRGLGVLDPVVVQHTIYTHRSFNSLQLPYSVSLHQIAPTMLWSSTVHFSGKLLSISNSKIGNGSVKNPPTINKTHLLPFILYTGIFQVNVAGRKYTLEEKTWRLWSICLFRKMCSQVICIKHSYPTRKIKRIAKNKITTLYRLKSTVA